MLMKTQVHSPHFTKPCATASTVATAAAASSLWLGTLALGLALPVQAQTQTPVTNAAQATQPTALKVSEIAFGLDHPWAVAFLPGGDYLVTERSGQMRLIDERGRVGAPLAGVPRVVAEGQGGLLDLVLDRQFEQNRRLFFCFAEADPNNSSRNSTPLASAPLAENRQSLENVQIIFHQMPRIKSELHFGCRIAQSQDGSLFLALGERSHARQQAQRTGNHLGKIVHLLPDGSPHPDNPFLNNGAGVPDIWSWGHRNPQGAVITPDGKLWVNEHGPQGGDELNLIERGKNYGWPIITHGRNYGIGTRIGEGTHKPGMEQPAYQWTPSIAPSGMAYLHSDRYGLEWQNSLFIGSLRFGTLHRMSLHGDTAQEEEQLLLGPDERIRDVRESPDGYLYLLTDSRNGRLLRIEPPEPVVAPPLPDEAPQATGTQAPDGAVPAGPVLAVPPSGAL